MCWKVALLSPFEPFHMANRFATANIFGILAFEALQVFDKLLFNSTEQPNQGVLSEILQHFGRVLIIGYAYIALSDMTD